MGDEQFKFPPGLKDPSQVIREWYASPSLTLVDMIECAQRDAVMAERRHVASQVAKGLQAEERRKALVESVKVRMGFGERLKELLSEFNSVSDTPPEILARYLQNCLGAFNHASMRRQQHFEQGPFPLPGVSGHKVEFPSLQSIRDGAVMERAGHRRETQPDFNFCVCHYNVGTYYDAGGKAFCMDCKKPIKLPSL